jgi:hypothetical protein
LSLPMRRDSPPASKTALIFIQLVQAPARTNAIARR